jgi:hypothetical protein
VLFRRTVQLPVRGKHWAEVAPGHLNQVRRVSICAKSPCVYRVGIAFWACYRQTGSYAARSEDSSKFQFADNPLGTKFNLWIGLFTSTHNEDPPCGDWFVTGGNPVALLANQVERHAYPESVQFGSSPNCGLQFANRAHGVSAHRSMCRKVAG